MLLGGQHQNGKDEEGGKEHFDEEAPDDTDIRGESGDDSCDIAGKHALDEGAGDDGTDDLGGNEEGATNPGQGAGDAHAEDDGGIKEAAADAVESPGGGGEGEAKGEGDEEYRLRRLPAVGVRVRHGCYLGGRQGEPEEEDGADKLARHGNQVGADVFPPTAFRFWG